MRASCRFGCETAEGYIVEKSGQDMVHCSRCKKHQYNAPRTETGRAVRTVQTTHAAIKPRLRAEVLMRAHWRCETCFRNPGTAAEELHVAHFLSVADGHTLGLTDAQINSSENLLCMCSECNLGLGRESIPTWLAVGIIRARTAGAKK
jgi:hypothetical protein